MAQGNTFNAALQCLRATKRPALRLAFQLIDSQIVRCDVRRSVTFALWLPAAARQIAVIGRVAAVAPRTAPVTGRAAVPHYGSFLIVAAREWAVIRCIAAATIGTAPAVRTASTRNRDHVRFDSDALAHHRRSTCLRRDDEHGDETCRHHVQNFGHSIPLDELKITRPRRKRLRLAARCATRRCIGLHSA